MANVFFSRFYPRVVDVCLRDGMYRRHLGQKHG